MGSWSGHGVYDLHTIHHMKLVWLLPKQNGSHHLLGLLFPLFLHTNSCRKPFLVFPFLFSSHLFTSSPGWFLIDLSHCSSRSNHYRPFSATISPCKPVLLKLVTWDSWRDWAIRCTCETTAAFYCSFLVSISSSVNFSLEYIKLASFTYCIKVDVIG